MAQIETVLHLQPDPQHEIDEQHNAVALGAQQADLLNPRTTADNKPEPAIPAVPPVGMQPIQPAGAAA